MADEIRIRFQLNVDKNEDSLKFDYPFTADMATGDIIFKSTQPIGTTTEQIVFSSDISGTPALVAFVNLSTTNYVEIGLNTPVTQIFAKLLAGQGLVMPAGTATYYAKANTAACNLAVFAFSA